MASLMKKLHAYQEQAVEHIFSHNKCGLFLDMGLGKTVSTLTAINRLIYEEVEVSKVLVIAPKRVAESVWKQEVTQWPHLQHLKVSVVTGNAMNRNKALQEKADIYTIGRDNVQWLCAQYGGSGLPFDMLVIDESSSFKNHASKRFKALKLVHFNRVVLLTGTPAPNSLIDLWPQIYLLDKGERLGRTIGAFRSDFFTPGRSNGHIVYNYSITKGSDARIHEAIADICMSMKAKDYLNLPERINNNIKLEMPETLRRSYKAFEREKVLEIFETDAQITSANAAALSNKLLQFANGAVYDSEKDTHEIHNLKLEALEEILESANGKPVLVAYTYKSDADRIEQYLKAYKPKRLETDADILKWNKGEIQLLMMHPASGGHGLNLQAGGNIIVWFGQTWSLELEQQFNARLDRQGQKQRVIVNKLILKGTMDEDVIAAQERKEKGQNALMEAVKAKIKQYKNQ
jgi:SNF2 family DNA or RNA helicase